MSAILLISRSLTLSFDGRGNWSFIGSTFGSFSRNITGCGHLADSAIKRLNASLILGTSLDSSQLEPGQIASIQFVSVPAIVSPGGWYSSPCVSNLCNPLEISLQNQIVGSFPMFELLFTLAFPLLKLHDCRCCFAHLPYGLRSGAYLRWLSITL